MNRSFLVLLLALSLPALFILGGSAQAAVVHQFDWTLSDPNDEGQPWANPPWNNTFVDGSSSFTNVGGTGRIFNGSVPPFLIFQALVHEVGVPNDTDPNSLLNLDLVTFSFDAMRDGSVTSAGNGLGFYAYDLINAREGTTDPNDQTLPNETNQGVMVWNLPNDGVNTNFLSARLQDNPDQWVHFDLVINASGATVGSSDNEVPNYHLMVFEDGVPLFDLDDPNTDFLTATKLETSSQGGYALSGDPDDPNTVPLVGAGVDTWGFRSFHEGAWHIDNFTVRDEHFVQSAGTPGDFNGDGHVDGLDFLLWQRDPGVGSLADWEANYGTWALVAAVSSVPEPTGAVLLMLAGSLAFLGRRPPPRNLIPRNMSEG